MGGTIREFRVVERRKKRMLSYVVLVNYFLDFIVVKNTFRERRASATMIDRLLRGFSSSAARHFLFAGTLDVTLTSCLAISSARARALAT